MTGRAARRDPPVRVLGLNPFIHDFAAYGLWSRPVGLLACLDMLRACGAEVRLLDCLEPEPGEDWPRPKPDGRGSFPKTGLQTPGPLRGAPRRYGRYGRRPEDVRRQMAGLAPRPDAVLTGCAMTYWYPGAVEAVGLAREVWPDAPVVLGGAWATLCPEHARSVSGADLVVCGPLERPDNWEALWRLLPAPAPPPPASPWLGLAPDLYDRPRFAPILGSRGCPFACPYCASGVLFPGFAQADPEAVLAALLRERDRGVRDFVFFDDALLVEPDGFLKPFLDGVVLRAPDIRLHAPNALHVRLLDAGLCRLLRRAGLVTLRLGFESADFEDRPDAKLTRPEWERGVACLREAGFDLSKVGCYVLAGLPGQDPAAVARAAAEVRAMGMRPLPAHYSPIPGTALFPAAQAACPWPLDREPLFHNPSLWPCAPGGWTPQAAERQRRVFLGP